LSIFGHSFLLEGNRKRKQSISTYTSNGSEYTAKCGPGRDVTSEADSESQESAVDGVRRRHKEELSAELNGE
jgi:hypothetical protein